jgi:hypothetical protein
LLVEWGGAGGVEGGGRRRVSKNFYIFPLLLLGYKKSCLGLFFDNLNQGKS